MVDVEDVSKFDASLTKMIDEFDLYHIFPVLVSVD